MRRIYYIIAFLFAGACWLACDDDDERIISKPDGITYGEATDQDGNVYKTLTLGKQTWLAENFRYRLKDGALDGCATYGEDFIANLADITSDVAATYRKYNSRLLPYLYHNIQKAGDEGKLLTSPDNPSTDRTAWLISYIKSYNMPYILQVQGAAFEPIAETLMQIWEESIATLCKTDYTYANEFGYLYSYEGAQKAVEEGAPEGFRLPTDADWMEFEKNLGMLSDELEFIDTWRGEGIGELLKSGEGGIGFDVRYGGASAYTLSTLQTSRYVKRNEGAYFWCSDQFIESDSIQNGILRNISIYESGIHRMSTRIIGNANTVQPSYSIRLVKTN